MKPSPYRLRLPDEIVKLLRELHPDLKKKVRKALSTIMEDPYEGKALKDDLAGLRSFRVSRFRIVYRISSRKQIVRIVYRISSRKQIEIVAMGPRKRIYEETFRILSKEK
jgi:mRNA interferase RelE/StbE